MHDLVKILLLIKFNAVIIKVLLNARRKMISYWRPYKNIFGPCHGHVLYTASENNLQTTKY